MEKFVLHLTYKYVTENNNLSSIIKSWYLKKG